MLVALLGFGSASAQRNGGRRRTGLNPIGGFTILLRLSVVGPHPFATTQVLSAPTFPVLL